MSEDFESTDLLGGELTAEVEEYYRQAVRAYLTLGLHRGFGKQKALARGIYLGYRELLGVQGHGDWAEETFKEVFQEILEEAAQAGQQVSDSTIRRILFPGSRIGGSF